MRRNTIQSVVCLAALAVSVSAYAQDGEQTETLRSYVSSSSRMISPQMMSFMPSDLVSLLGQPHIVQELKVTEEQQTSIREIMMTKQKARMESGKAMQKLSEEMRKNFAAGKRPDQEAMREVQKFRQDYMDAQAKVQADADKAIFAMPEKKQAQRLLQVQLQIALKNYGLTSIAQEPLAENLTVTPDQKRKLVEKQIEMKQELDEMVEVLRAEMQHQTLTDVLTKSQLNKLGAMQGDDLTTKRPDYYSQTLRRQVLKEQPSFGAKLLDGARKVVDDVKKDFKDDKKKSDK
jgi:hypothetical protein